MHTPVKASFCRLLLSIFSICGFQASRVSSFTQRKVGLSVWDTISSFSCNFYLLLWSGKGEESVVCFANVYLKAPVQCPLVDTIDGFLDPVGCSGGCVQVYSRLPARLHVVCLRPSLLWWYRTTRTKTERRRTRARKTTTTTTSSTTTKTQISTSRIYSGQIRPAPLPPPPPLPSPPHPPLSSLPPSSRTSSSHPLPQSLSVTKKSKSKRVRLLGACFLY